MAGRKKNGDDDTDTTVEDLVRDLAGSVTKLADSMTNQFGVVHERFDRLETEMREGFAEVKAEVRRVEAGSIARDRKLEARVSRLETRAGKKRKKPRRTSRRL